MTTSIKGGKKTLSKSVAMAPVKADVKSQTVGYSVHFQNVF